MCYIPDAETTIRKGPWNSYLLQCKIVHNHITQISAVIWVFLLSANDMDHHIHIFKFDCVFVPHGNVIDDVWSLNVRCAEYCLLFWTGSNAAAAWQIFRWNLHLVTAIVTATCPSGTTPPTRKESRMLSSRMQCRLRWSALCSVIGRMKNNA